MGDGAVTVWNHWWAKKALIDLGTNPFTTTLLSHPRATSLVFHSHDLLHGLLTIPFQLLLEHPRGLILGTNFILLFCYLLSALAAYACAWSETRDPVASLAAGAGYGFCAFHVTTFSMPVVSAMYWVPLYVLTLRRALVEPGIAWTAAAGLCVLLCTFQSLYYTALLGLVTVVVVGFRLGQTRFDRSCVSRALGVIAALGLAIGPMAAIALGDLGRTVYSSVVSNVWFTIDHEASLNSVDLASLVIPSPIQGWWRFVPAVESWNDYLMGPWDFSTGFRATRGGLIAYVGVVPLVLAAIGASRRPRDSVLLWLALAGVSLGIALGPFLYVHGLVSDSRWLPMPYRLLSAMLPEALTRMFRSPYTFMAVAYLALWMLAALGIARLRAQLGSGSSRVVGSLVLAAWLVGEHAYAMPEAYPVRLTPALERIAEDERAVSILEIPTSDRFALEVYSMHQALHQKPIASGFLARRSAAVFERDRQLRSIGDSAAALGSVLSEMRPVYAVIHRYMLKTPVDRRQARMVEAVLTGHEVYRDDWDIVYRWD
jgi:hypothetical protein